MSRARKVPVADDLPEPDRIDGQPHPRETYRLTGQDAALIRAARAIRSGRPPHAWLIAGPPGIGKATLAYRIARYVLRYGATQAGPADLAVPTEDRAAHLVEKQSHPGLLVLRRPYNFKTSKLMTVVSVDEIRKVGEFFGMTATEEGGWRIAIVDSADEMNDQAANALLKILEEPPARALLMVIANAPGRLLPTIRSRCRRLDLRPLDAAAMSRELEERLPDMAAEDRAALAAIAEGSLGLALSLANDDGLVLAREAEALVARSGAPDIRGFLALAEKFARGGGEKLPLFGRFLTQTLAKRIRARAASRGAAELDRWVTLWEKLERNFARADALNLDPRQTVLGSAFALAETKRAAGGAP